ncbi:uncharacterized protein LOC128962944 [Oppia nitens]|uniref:uncharacterized protein LOC128962944 n=1 Tax=Oppia nitens TaxID=1686743 RepID=UPI0023DA446E|nr:uncharacterized protein LOC128962944 [Oppia nitens]
MATARVSDTMIGGTRQTTTTKTRALVLDDMSDESVRVTHVETPERFYCRLVSDDQPLAALNELIAGQTQCGPLAVHVLVAIDDVRPGEHLLAYSTIHQQWCRCRVQQLVLAANDSPISPINLFSTAATADSAKWSARVLLTDYGSVEVVAAYNLRHTTGQIVDANNGQPFCFECRLAAVKPYLDSQEWSSYANYLFERLTKDQPICLRVVDQCDTTGVIVCDLSSIGGLGGGKQSFPSMVDHLVGTRVARYRVGEDFYHKLLPDDYEGCDHETNGDFDWHSDDSDNEEEFGGNGGHSNSNNDNKLYYI